MTPYSEKEQEEAAREVNHRVRACAENPCGVSDYQVAITLCMQNRRRGKALEAIANEAETVVRIVRDKWGKNHDFPALEGSIQQAREALAGGDGNGE